MQKRLISNFMTGAENESGSLALRTALGDITKGGEIAIDTDIDIDAPVLINDNNDVSFAFVGDTGSKVNLKSSLNESVFHGGNRESVTFEGINFFGQENRSAYDCGNLFFFSYTNQAIVKNCRFYDVMPYYHLLYAGARTKLAMENCIGGGTMSREETFYLDNPFAATFKMCEFFDYGNENGNYYDKAQSTSAWFNIQGNLQSAASQLVEIQQCILDERATVGMIINNCSSVNIKGLTMNVSHLPTAGGLLITNSDVEIEDSRLGTGNTAPFNGQYAIKRTGSEETRLNHVKIQDGLKLQTDNLDKLIQENMSYQGVDNQPYPVELIS